MRPYWELCKPRITLMVMLTAGLGYWLAGGREGILLLWVVIGSGLASAASGCLNQWWEKDVDGFMKRTAARPLPSGRVEPRQALQFGLTLGITGCGALAWGAGWQAAGLAALTMALYLLAYTPLKRVTPHSTWVGAVAGAIPPLIGWVAARGRIDLLAWILFALQLVWQIPHFLAMFWIHREDYARAGFKVMPVVEPGGTMTAFQIALHSFGVVLVSLMPSVFGVAGRLYGLGALIVGIFYMYLGMRASWTMSVTDTRRLFHASLVYLPVIFIMLMLGGNPS